MGVRRKARELVLQVLFQSEFLEKPASEQLPVLVSNFQVNKKALPYATDLLEGVCENRSLIDSIIKKYAANWRLDRMSVIDRNIIRISTHELLFCKDIPATVSINEAIEIARKYSTDESCSFINGILDSINKHEIKDSKTDKK